MSEVKGPVIVITGTPGTGKTTLAQLLAEESPVPLKHVNVGELVKEKNLYEEYDEEWWDRDFTLWNVLVLAVIR